MKDGVCVQAAVQCTCKALCYISDINATPGRAVRKLGRVTKIRCNAKCVCQRVSGNGIELFIMYITMFCELVRTNTRRELDGMRRRDTRSRDCAPREKTCPNVNKLNLVLSLCSLTAPIFYSRWVCSPTNRQSIQQNMATNSSGPWSPTYDAGTNYTPISQTDTPLSPSRCSYSSRSGAVKTPSHIQKRRC